MFAVVGQPEVRQIAAAVALVAFGGALCACGDDAGALDSYAFNG